MHHGRIHHNHTLSTSVMVKQIIQCLTQDCYKEISRVVNPSLHASLASFTFSMQWLQHNNNLGQIPFPWHNKDLNHG
ncbi:Meiosis inhibitor 1 [Gossypium arboreum]|uniref:Meiosis inhibitor 1 n=1 Tax=Gossypium arboreum TaxID=29729 RepID=A0A0B0PQN5_GOSAR|nr:Meiosis inhibitor 1 [Gossypium arboreum]